MARGRKFGIDWPLPEVGSLVAVVFDGGNPAHPWFLGQPRYQEGNFGAPDLDKDKHRDWSLRLSLQNGFEFCVDTDGNVVCVVPGNFNLKIMCDGVISARGVLFIMGVKLWMKALSVLRMLAPTKDEAPYPRSHERGMDRELTIEQMRPAPGEQDPKIGKVPDLE